MRPFWLLLALAACAPDTAGAGSRTTATTAAAPVEDDHAPAPVPTAGPGQEVAVFAGGCFWCIETDFDKLDGVVATTSGFAGGTTKNPTYEQVGHGEGGGHAEALHVVFDTKKLTYAQVLDYFWHHIDPTDAGGQFCDRGDQYRSEVYPQTPEQAEIAAKTKAVLEASGVLPGPVVTQITPGQQFWPAEIYHQDFHVKNPGRYLPYRMGCGRDARVAEVWAKAKP